jgi:sulfhydrogenase subunit beta (sulfur reductase)
MIIKQKNLERLIDDVAAERTLIAPRDVAGVTLYRPVENSSQVVWDYIKPVLSAKEVFFPATERLLTIKKTGQEIEINETLPEGQQVIFGLRPCDARGILALDAAFLDTEPVDSYYQERRQNTTLIGLACEEMGETCFCTTMGSAPNDPSGMDIMLAPVDGGYELQAYTDKGALFLGDVDMQIQKTEPVNPQSDASFPQTIPPKFNFQYWVEMSERCLSCRVCAYVCPTCRCFDVRDEALSGNGDNEFERIRCWDSCAGEIYRRVAGGHNPRAAKAQRMRNRFQCKIYYYPQQYGPLACTGCGRCIDSCPVNIDITEIMDHLAEVSA